MSRTIVITGGGTGGHIFPMQAIADALRANGVDDSDLRYVGSRRGQEASLLGGGPISLTLLPGRGIRRSLAPRALRDNVVALVGLAIALVRAALLIGRWRPALVISVGGYASFAVAASAIVWRRPLVLVNLDAHAPATHRLLDRFATLRCEAFGVADDRTVVTGAPVREVLAQIDRSPSARLHARAMLTPPVAPERQVVVVMTGSLGASSVNRAVLELATLWAARGDRTIVHITGRRDFDWVSAQRPVLDGLDYRIEAFGDMATWWAVADAAVCRAGALTVAELAVLGIPAVLVPLPGAPGDHQTANARALALHNAARMVRDEDVKGAVVAELLDELLLPATNAATADAARALSHPDAAARIATAALAVRHQ